MARKYTIIYLFSVILLVLTAFSWDKNKRYAEGVLLKNVRLIDGNGGQPVENADILIRGGSIAEIGTELNAQGVKIINMTGKTIMPAMTSAHVHIGVINGNISSGTNYTRANVLSQLNKYQNYGIGTVHAMGTDRPLLFEQGIRDSSVKGLLPGARMYSAGYGFNVPDLSVSTESFLGNLYRPSDVSEIPGMMAALAKLKPTMVKIWVDGSPVTKMKPVIYQSVIKEAHKHNLRVAAHVYYLSDARKLVDAGVDIFAHSVRDSVIDDALVRQMKAKNIAYIPTLSLDEFAFIYAQKPDWIDDDFFKASLEPGVYEMITSESWQNNLKSSPDYQRNMNGFQVALKNVKKLHDAGILVCLGTDSGAFPIRAQGFAEHLELQLLVQAGLTPLQAITIATKNASKLLKLDRNAGTIEKGKLADFIVQRDNPVENIRNTRSIEAVYKSGILVSRGPLAD